MGRAGQGWARTHALPCCAQVLAAQALAVADGPCVAAGQAYMISDGAPVNNFEFLRPLITGLGFR